MDELEERIRAHLVDVIGTGNVAVVDGPLADPMVVEKRPLFDDSSLGWALQRYREHARNLTTESTSPDNERSRRPVSIVYITPINQVHLVVQPTPARDVQGPVRTKLNVPLLQPHHVHHRRQRLGSYAISDFSPHRQHVTIFLPGAERYGARFEGKGYRHAFDGVGYARKGKYLLVNGDQVPVADYDAQRAAVMKVKREAAVILRYTYADGITLTGNTKFYKDRIAATSGTVLISRRGGADRVVYRFKWSPKQVFWYVPKSRNTAWSRAAVEEVAEALRIHGIPNVEVKYQSPRDVGVEPAFEPEVRPPEKTPHGWPPIPLDDATAKRMPEAQLRAIPQYTAEDYRWHDIQLGRSVIPIRGFATNILGHLIVAHPPSEPLSRFWVLVVDGERWGRGQEEFFVLANNFHTELVPTLEPAPQPRRSEPVDDDAIATARAGVAGRKARSRALDDVARAAGIEVCPRAIFEIDPVPQDREQIKQRAEAFADLVRHYRRLHRIELWSAGKLDSFPRDEALALNNRISLPREIGDPLNPRHSVGWARERYDAWLETTIGVMKPRDPQEAARVLDFCVRDIAGGRRRARAGRPHSRPAEPLDLLTYRAAEHVVAPAPASEQRVVTRRSGKKAQTKDVARIAAAWSAHVAGRPQHERPWSNVPKTSCFVRREEGVDVTLCPTPQTRPVENCPPMVTTIQDKARRVMLCGGDEGVQFFGSVADANLEGENMALRKRLRQAPAADAGWPAADDFVAQERFLDALVPARLVFDKEWPFKLLPVEVGPPRVSAGTESRDVTAWADTEVPAGAELEPQVLVAGRATGLREFVDALGDELFVYRGHASQATIDGLRKHLSIPQRSTLGRNKTANDIGHGIFGGRSLYWLGDQSDFVGPVFANGRLASGRAKEEVLERFSRPMPLPDMLPWGWTLDDSIVIAALVGGEPAWNVWNSTSASFSHKRESQDVWADPQRLPRESDPNSGEGDYAGAALSTLNKLIDRTAGTVRFRVAGPWLGLVFPSDYGSRVAFDAPTGGKLDLEQLERERDHYQQLSVEDADHIDDYKRAKRRVEWAQKWLSEQQGPKHAAMPKRAPQGKPKLAVVPTAKERTATPEPAEPSRAPMLTVVAAIPNPTDANRRLALSLARNAWESTPGSSTNYVDEGELGAALALIREGLLERTGEEDYGDRRALLARLTPAGLLEVGLAQSPNVGAARQQWQRETDAYERDVRAWAAIRAHYDQLLASAAPLMERGPRHNKGVWESGDWLRRAMSTNPYSDIAKKAAQELETRLRAAGVPVADAPSQAARSTKPAEPAKPGESKPTDATLEELARSLGVTRDGGHTIGDRMALLYEAEKRGWGPRMRTWLVKNRMIKSEWAIEYGARARGRLAFERGEPWPPPPARGDTYSATEYAGILWSLRDSPEALAAVALGKQWTEWMKRTGAARFYRDYDMARDVEHHLDTRTSAVFDTEKTAAAARARYDRMKVALDARMQAMRLSMDPALYDKSRGAAQVYKTLCEISYEAAKATLEGVYGVRFLDKRDHYELCDGQQSLEDLDRKGHERAREDAAHKAESNRVRLADARALLAVAEEASKRGELTEKRFNAAYWRLHPEIRGHARESRRLQLTWFPSFRRTRGVAPASSDKATEAWVRGPSDHGFHAKVYKAPGEVAVVEALVAELRREAAKLEATVSDTDAPSPSKPASSSKPKGARKPPKPATTPRPAVAAAAEAADVERREDTNMSVMTGEKKTAKTAGSKKKATAKKTSKKATAKKTSKKATARKATAKKTSKKAASKKAASKKATSKKAASKQPVVRSTNGAMSRTNGEAKTESTIAAPKPLEPKPASQATPDTATTRSLRFKRNDVVRFRKRSQIAAGLGVGLDKQFKVEMVTTDQGRTMVVLRVGQGKHSALIKVPPGHLAIIERGQEIPAEIRQCAARLSRFKGPITPKTRRLLAELAGRA